MNTKNPEAMKFAAIVGGNLKYCRTKKVKFMPMKVPAAHIGVSYQQINKYESGYNLVDSFRLKQFSEFYGVSTDDLLDPTFIHRDSIKNEVTSKAASFDATKYEQFDDEYPPGSAGLEHDPKMQCTYDAILDNKED